MNVSLGPVGGGSPIAVGNPAPPANNTPKPSSPAPQPAEPVQPPATEGDYHPIDVLA